jgi:hypothetical protein
MRCACEDDRSYEPVMKGIGELQRELSAMNAVSGAKPAASVGAKASSPPGCLKSAFRSAMLDKAESASLLVQMMKETEHGALNLLDLDIHLDQNGSCSFFFSLLS